MAKVETRLACPVCLGVKMQKTKIGRGNSQIMLDHCARCGGVWFELGEIQRLRSHQPDALWRKVPQRDYEPRPQCHSCHTPISRSLTKCTACGHDNQLDCPNCQKPLQIASESGLTLDVCKQCKGVWFDHAELEAIWKLEVSRAVQRRGVAAGAALEGGEVLMHAMFWSPDLMFLGAHAAGQAVGAAGSVLSNAPELVASAGEVIMEAASSVFEAIVSLLEGLG